MAFHILLISVLLYFVFGGSHGTMTNEELHWKSVFPHTPMPKVLQQILPIPGQSILFQGDTGLNQKDVINPQFRVYGYGDDSDKESKIENSPNNKGVNDPEFGAYWYGDNSDKESKAENSPNNKGVNDPEFGAYWYGDNSDKEHQTRDSDSTKKGVNDDHFGLYFVGDSSEQDPKRHSDKEHKTEDINPANKGANDDHFGLYFVGDSSEQDPKKHSDREHKTEDINPAHKGVNDDHFGLYFVGDDSEQNPKIYSTEKSTVHTAPNKKGNRKALGGKSGHENTQVKETIYFFQENLLPGTEVNLPRLIQKSDMATFLPQQIADSMPFSNDNLPQILKNFSLKAESKGANDVKTTVRNCDRSEMKGETKYCATSLESFVDLGVSVLGKHIRLLSHDIGKETKDPYFTIGQGVQKMGDNNIVCHKMKYPYAVYLCHSIEKTEVYKVSLVSKDGTKVKAVAACHKDTSNWSPNHIAFKIVKVKPGTVPICHFLGRDTLVWIPY